MRKPISFLAFAISALMIVSPLISLGHTETPKKGGDLIIVHTPFNHLNSAIQSGIATMIPGAQLFAGLVRLDENFQPLPYLAESWEISDNGLTYTFHLVKNATFHDGKPITSEDVAFSLDIVKNNHPFGIAMFAAVDRVETPDPHTAVFKLNRPNPSMLVSLSPVLMSIIPKHVYGTGGPIRTHPANNKPVGSGPFKFAECKPGEYLILERYDKFFLRGRPYLDRLILNLMKDYNAMVIAMEREQAHYMSYAKITLRDIDRLSKLDHITGTKRGYEAIGPLNWLAFNLRKPPVKDVRVRQAIAYATDREFITQKLHIGRSKPATGPLHSGSLFYSGDVNNYDLDLDKANKMLDEAGYPRKKNGVRFSIRLDWAPWEPEFTEAVAQYLKAQLKKIGINVQLRSSPDFPTWAKRIGNWDFDLTIDEVFNYPDPLIGVHRTYLCDNIKKGVIWSNTQSYCNPRVDELLAKAGVEMDLAKRKSIYTEFQEIVTDELPVYYLIEIPYHTLYNNKVGNPPLTVWGAMGPFDEVYLK